MEKRYEFPLPTTGALFFASYVTSVSQSEDSLQLLAAASTQRAQLRDVLKTLKRSDHKGVLTVLKTIQDYLPLLYGLIESLEDPPSMALQRPLITDWRAVFLDNKIPGKAFPRSEYPGIQFELNFVLLTLGCAMANHAMNEEASLQKAADSLCKAAGTFEYINKNVIPAARSALTGMPKPTPETYPELSAALTKYSLGRAQLCALSQLEAKASHSILCRIAVGASDHFSSAIGIISSHPMKKALPHDLLDEIIAQQKKSLSNAYLYLGREQAKLGNTGFAIGCAKLAEQHYKDQKTADAVREWTRENNQVSYQDVASSHDVQNRLPSGRDFVKIIPFTRHLTKNPPGERHDSYAGEGGYY